MKTSFLFAAAFSLIAQASFASQITIQGSLYPASNPEGRCGASESGLILEGSVASNKNIYYNECGDDISKDLKVSPSLEVVSSDKNARRAYILQKVSEGTTQYLFTIEGATVTKDSAFGGTVTAIETLDKK